jgi:hypothetical protein
MVRQILRKLPVCSFYLPKVVASHHRFMAPATQPEAEAVRIEVLGKAWKPGRMMRSDKPSRHPVAVGEQVCDPCVNMIPGHPRRSPLPERGLVLGIELTQVVKCGRDRDIRYEVWRRLASKAERAFGTLPRPASNAPDMPFVEVRFRPRSWRGVRKKIRTLEGHVGGPSCRKGRSMSPWL